MSIRTGYKIMLLIFIALFCGCMLNCLRCLTEYVCNKNHTWYGTNKMAKKVTAVHTNTYTAYIATARYECKKNELAMCRSQQLHRTLHYFHPWP